MEEVLQYARDSMKMENAGALCVTLDRWIRKGMPTDGVELGSLGEWKLFALEAEGSTIMFRVVVASGSERAIILHVRPRKAGVIDDGKADFQLATRRLAYMHENK